MTNCPECQEVEKSQIFEESRSTMAFKCPVCKKIREIGWIERYGLEEDELVIFEVPCEGC